MANYIFIWFGCLLVFILIGIVVAPRGKSQGVSDVLGVLSESDMAESVEKFINSEPKSWSEKQQRVLEQSRTGITLQNYILLMVFAMVLFFAVGLFVSHNFIFALVIAAVGWFVPGWYVKWKREKVLEEFDSELIRPLDRMIAILSAGRTPNQAVAEIAHATDIPRITQIEFEAAFVEMEFGTTIEDAFYNMADRTGSENIMFLATQLAINREQGGNLAKILEKIRSSVEERVRLKGDLRSITAEQRSQANMLIMVFVVILGITLIIEPSLKDVLFGTVTGRFMLMIAIGMMTIGSIIIRRMTR